jgi:pSer/pThr/pTyr-binding forkhead associated (FHA) protein
VEPRTIRQRTYVNGEPVEGRRVLESGDELGLGSIQAIFSAPSPLRGDEQNQGVL